MTHNQRYNIYIASCNENGGIYHYILGENGKLTQKGFTPMDRPMYLKVHNGKMYILLRAPFESNAESGLICYDIDRKGALTNPSQIISTKGEVACHLEVNDDKIYCVNYISGSIVSLPDGKLVKHRGKGVNAKRQESAHTHFVCETPDKKYLAVTDLGLDTVFLYDKELNCISKAKVPDGHGVRHLIFDEEYCFSANELESTLSVFRYNNGKLEIADTVSLLPEDFSDESTASAIRLENDRIYVSNRGHNSISVLEYKNSKLKNLGTFSSFGAFPRDFDIIGNYIISTNELSNSVTVLDKETKECIDTVEVTSPVCVVYTDLE